MTSAWTKRTSGWDAFKTCLTTIIFARLARMYGFVTIPAMPPHPTEATERAISIRRLMRVLRSRPDAILCLAPEGMDFPDGILGEPHPGSGKFIIQLYGCLHQILPVGVYEDGGVLTVNFGKPYSLNGVENDRNQEKAVIHTIMRHIAALLPVKMRGIYGKE